MKNRDDKNVKAKLRFFILSLQAFTLDAAFTHINFLLESVTLLQENGEVLLCNLPCANLVVC